jgi:hypothetical protein
MKTILLHLLCFALINIGIVPVGYLLVKKRQIILSWLLLISSILIIHLIFVHEGAILRMLAIIATTFTAMKVIAVAEGYKTKAQFTLTFKQWAVFSSGWAGMRAQPFETLGAIPLAGAWPMIRFGISRVVIGLLLILVAHGIVALNLNRDFTYVTVSIILLVGLSLILHFGLLGISAGMWRLSGVNTYLLFRQPAKATSLTELWSKRWNIAFSEMTAVAIFRPLKSRIGSGGALMASFIFSGLLHELALSVPVNSGYGLPTLYFLIQGLLVLVEKASIRHHILFLQHKIIGRIWTFFWLIIPMPLLFHLHFIKEIVWPLAGLK